MMFVPFLLQIHAGPMGVNPSAGPHVINTYTYTVHGAPTLNVKTANGTITISRGAANVISVRVNRRAETQAAAQALVETVGQHGSVVTAIGRAPENCTDRCGSVDFTIAVPQNASVMADSSNGEIHINDIDGAVSASTDNGAILCGGLAGDVSLSSSNGRLNAGFRSLAHVSKVSLTSSNGSLRVVVPKGAKIRVVNAHTDNGKVYSQLALNPEQNGSVAEVDRQLGDSGPAIDFKTSNGDIVLTVSP